LYSWAANLVSAGVRLVPLGQTAGQRVLAELHPFIERASGEAAQLPDERLEGCGFGLSLASMAHETQYTRLFRS
jgi:urease accessory protein